LCGTPWNTASDSWPTLRFICSIKSRRPALIGHGNKDGNLIASDAIFAALKRSTLPVLAFRLSSQKSARTRVRITANLVHQIQAGSASPSTFAVRLEE